MNAAEEIDVTIEGVLADGTPVKAKCRYRAKDISVELFSPYPGQHAGRHIMFMSPRTYTANEYWKKAAWELLEELVAQGRWISSHPDEVGARRREAKRRIGIVQKYVEALVAERKTWKRQLKDGSVDQRTYQLGIVPINKAIQALELIAFEQEESNWLRNGIVEPFSCSARPPSSSRRTDMKNVNVYLRDSALVSKREDGWRCVLETQVPKADLAGCGLGLFEDNPATIDVAAFSAYLKRRDCGKIDFVLDAWREIAREDDTWCATMA